jgi:hypothetical protein
MLGPYANDKFITPCIQANESEVNDISEILPMIGLNAKIDLVEETEHEITYLVKVQKR